MKCNDDMINELKYWLSDKYPKQTSIYYLHKYYNILKSESELDDFFTFLFSYPGCSNHCFECGFCDKYAKRLLNTA
jgi:hypothetical protein